MWPVFVFDPDVLEHAAPPRVAFLLDALESLRERYREHGSDLLVIRGNPAEEFPRLAEETGAEASSGITIIQISPSDATRGRETCSMKWTSNMPSTTTPSTTNPAR